MLSSEQLDEYCETEGELLNALAVVLDSYVGKVSKPSVIGILDGLKVTVVIQQD